MSQPSTAAPPAVQATAPPSSPEPVRSRDLLQSISADYFNISDGDGKPIASLIVLVDRHRTPVRAELHLGGQITEEAGRQAVRQAQHVLEDRYAGPETLPMQVWQSFLRSDPLQVPLPPAEPGRRNGKATAAPTKRSSAKSGSSLPTSLFASPADSLKRIPWKPVVFGLGALAVIALVWGLISWIRPDAGRATTAAPASGGVQEQLDTQPPAGDLAPVDQPIDEGAAGAVDLEAEAAGGLPAQASALPPSANAHPDLTHGMRVRIKDGLRLVLRSEPGATAGEPLGYMQDGQEAEIISGPVMLPGNSDTIVWWQVRIDNDGTIAWAAANTSELMLLEPAD